MICSLHRFLHRLDGSAMHLTQIGGGVSAAFTLPIFVINCGTLQFSQTTIDQCEPCATITFAFYERNAVCILNACANEMTNNKKSLGALFRFCSL